MCVCFTSRKVMLTYVKKAVIRSAEEIFFFIFKFYTMNNGKSYNGILVSFPFATIICFHLNSFKSRVVLRATLTQLSYINFDSKILNIKIYHYRHLSSSFSLMNIPKIIWRISNPKGMMSFVWQINRFANVTSFLWHWFL